MQSSLTRVSLVHLLLAAAVWLMAGAVAPAHAATFFYRGDLSGANESPVNASPAVGHVEVTIDDVAHTMHIAAIYSGLQGNSSACHIHAPTPTPFTGTAGVATTTPAFVGFPLGVTSGSYDNVIDLTLTSSYNSSFVTAHGGTAAGAEAFLLASIGAGESYFNLHSTSVPGGEIRSFLVPFDPTPTAKSTWGRVKSLYH